MTFKTFDVILHNVQKHHKWRRVRKCVSGDAAVRVANRMERLKWTSNPYTATNYYEVDNNGNRIFTH